LPKWSACCRSDRRGRSTRKGERPLRSNQRFLTET
jgi:hypothetical protein